MVRLSRSSQQRGSSGRCGARRAGIAARSSSARRARRASRMPAFICRRSTDATSRSARSGTASRSPCSRARAWSPSGPSSARATTRTLASATITVVADRGYGVLERDRSAGSPARAVEDLLQGRLVGLFDQPGPQVLLEGLVSGGRALAEDRVRPVGHVLDLDARHGAIVALKAPKYNRNDGALYCQLKSGASSAIWLRTSAGVLAVPRTTCPSLQPGKIKVSGKWRP